MTCQSNLFEASSFLDFATAIRLERKRASRLRVQRLFRPAGAADLRTGKVGKIAGQLVKEIFQESPGKANSAVALECSPNSQMGNPEKQFLGSKQPRKAISKIVPRVSIWGRAGRGEGTPFAQLIYGREGSVESNESCCKGVCIQSAVNPFELLDI
jgi:hypothetical protein